MIPYNIIIIILESLSFKDQIQILEDESNTSPNQFKRLREEIRTLKLKLEDHDRHLKQSRIEMRQLKESRLKIKQLTKSLSKLKSFHHKTVSTYRKKLKMFQSKFQTLHSPNKGADNTSSLTNQKNRTETKGKDSMLVSLFKLCSHCGTKMETRKLKSLKFDFFKMSEKRLSCPVNISSSDSDEDETGETEEVRVSLPFNTYCYYNYCLFYNEISFGYYSGDKIFYLFATELYPFLLLLGVLLRFPGFRIILKYERIQNYQIIIIAKKYFEKLNKLN